MFRMALASPRLCLLISGLHLNRINGFRSALRAFSMISGALRSANSKNAGKLAQAWRRKVPKPANQVPAAHFSLPYRAAVGGMISPTVCSGRCVGFARPATCRSGVSRPDEGYSGRGWLN